MIDFDSYLNAALENPLFIKIAHSAIDIIRYSDPVSIVYGHGKMQPSAELAKTYTLRRSLGYFDKKNILGLDETIESLRAVDGSVCLRYAQIDSILISVWIDGQSRTVAGLLVSKPAN